MKATAEEEGDVDWDPLGDLVAGDIADGEIVLGLRLSDCDLALHHTRRHSFNYYTHITNAAVEDAEKSVEKVASVSLDCMQHYYMTQLASNNDFKHLPPPPRMGLSRRCARAAGNRSATAHVSAGAAPEP